MRTDYDWTGVAGLVKRTALPTTLKVVLRVQTSPWVAISLASLNFRGFTLASGGNEASYSTVDFGTLVFFEARGFLFRSAS